MEKLIKPYDKEFMRMAMLKHEETFKEQVHELHRLYQIQKILMRNIENSRANGRSAQEIWNTDNGTNFKQSNVQQKSSMKLDLEQPAGNYIAESNGNGALEIIDESEIVLTLGPTSYTRRKKKETPHTSDSGWSFSSSSTGSSHINRKGFQTQQRSNRARELLGGYELGLLQVPDTRFGCPSGSINSLAHNGEQLRSQQEIHNQPSWLFQVLSLNMT